jgi:hypothetical protein
MSNAASKRMRMHGKNRSQLERVLRRNRRVDDPAMTLAPSMHELMGLQDGDYCRHYCKTVWETDLEIRDRGAAWMENLVPTAIRSFASVQMDGRIRY